MSLITPHIRHLVTPRPLVLPGRTIREGLEELARRLQEAAK